MKYLLLLFMLLLASPLQGSEYVPVDQMGGVARIPRLGRHLQRPQQYNPRLHGRRMFPQTMPGTFYRPHDPNIGRWVSMPAEYMPAEWRDGNLKIIQVAAASLGASPQSGATPGKVKLFGTVEFGRPLSSVPDWLQVLKRNQNSPIFQDAKYLSKKKTWAQLRDEASSMGKLDQLRLVNRFWNTWPYREDAANWGQPDYWAIPAEFLKKSGDCEDYAIVKYFTLKELGFNPQNMRLVVLRDTIRNLAHAVLAVYLDGDAYILDNLSNTVLSHRRLANYSPQYSVNEFGRWAHIRGKSASR